MTLISTVTVGLGGAASIDFNSISGSYTDLKLYVSCKPSTAGEGYILISLNGSSSNFTGRQLEGNGAAASSATYTVGRIGVHSGSTWGGFTNNEIYIPNYSGSTTKSLSGDSVTEQNATTSYQDLFATLWTNTAAITSISLSTASTVSFAQHSTASLYGILKGSGGATVS
jgi:hypothetical protein